MRVVGLDPSLSNFGMAKGIITGDRLSLTDLSLVQSPPDNKNKKQVRKNSADLERARNLYKGMTEFLADTDLVFVEVPVGSQSARSMASYGICIGLLASISIPMIQVTPAEVKLAATGNKNATKRDMIAWATQAFPESPWLTRKTKGEVTFIDKNEHLADALATIFAGVRSETYQQLLALKGAA